MCWLRKACCRQNSPSRKSCSFPEKKLGDVGPFRARSRERQLFRSLFCRHPQAKIENSTLFVSISTSIPSVPCRDIFYPLLVGVAEGIVDSFGCSLEDGGDIGERMWREPTMDKRTGSVARRAIAREVLDYWVGG